MLIGSWDSSPQKMVGAAYANMVCSIIFSFTLFFSYKYSQNIKKRKTSYFVLIITLSISLIAIAFSLWGILANKHFPPTLMRVFLIVFPFLTTTSFLPSALQSFEQKKFGGMSKGMLFTLLFINTTWLLYWIALGFNRNEFNGDIIATIIWQGISFIMYSGLAILVFIEKTHKKRVQPY